MSFGGLDNADAAIANLKGCRLVRSLAPLTGFGFLEFSRKEDAMKVLKELQGSELEGR